ncbi:MAG: XRE family transcriptional regulator [Acidobacteria bacterium]|nr:MAG: XRE family transcriptional regulator [Acidobacteriota bacterium]
MTPEKAFGQVLRDLRTKRNLSQEKLALEGGLDRTFISLLERGLRQPSLITIFQISKVLNLSPDEIIRKVVEKMNTR